MFLIETRKNKNTSIKEKGKGNGTYLPNDGCNSESSMECDVHPWGFADGETADQLAAGRCGLAVTSLPIPGTLSPAPTPSASCILSWLSSASAISDRYSFHTIIQFLCIYI